VKYALVGYGKMGRAVEAAAAARGHVLAVVVDRTARGKGVSRTIGDASWRGVKTAFEFTEPSAAREHVVDLLLRGISVVCGTTGWDASDKQVRNSARVSSGGAVIAANFSVGMNLFYQVVADAARRYLTVGDYDPWIVEWHHRGKADAPSGTARRLAAMVAAAGPSPSAVCEGLPAGMIPRGDIHVASLRAGHEPGRHRVGFDGKNDAITLEHAARGRAGFAEGAVLAAEWLRGRQGLHGFDEVVDDLAGPKRRRGGRR
jgi:4-hydroxy-tetrahydrodipicolinate reductase